MTLQELTSTVQNKLNQRFGSAIISLETQYDSPIFTIDKEQIADILLFLYHDTELSFQFLTTLCGLHYPDQIGKELGVMYQLHSLPNNFRIRLKAWMPISEPKIPTVTTVFASANWQERETFDFYGIQFVGHPNLRRILNMDEMNYFPLRKEYPLEDMRREDKNDNMFGR
jgi:NADH-quinone oxidoreductase subunit C